jgi:hypothetical protein
MEEEVKRGRGRPPRLRDAEPDEAFVSDEGFERVIVSRGKTVVMPHPTMTKVIRMDESGAVVRAPLQEEYSEDAEIMLDAALVHSDGKGGYFSEATRLIRLGIVHRPGEAQMIPAALSEGSRVVEIGTPRQTNVSPVNNAMRT